LQAEPLNALLRPVVRGLFGNDRHGLPA
jgi:hypothetical protein